MLSGCRPSWSRRPTTRPPPARSRCCPRRWPTCPPPSRPPSCPGPRGSRPRTLEAAIAEVDEAAVALENAADSAELNAEQREAVDTLLRPVQPAAQRGRLRQPRPVHLAGPPAPPRRDRCSSAPSPTRSSTRTRELELLDHTLDGRLSLAMQQLQVAYGAATAANPVELSSEVGVEAAAIDRLGVALGPTTPLVLQLKQQNALHFGSVKSALDTTLEAANAGEPGKGIALDLGGEEAYAPYDELTADLFTSIEDDLASRRERGPDPGHRELGRHRPRPPGRDHPGAAGLALAAEPDPPGARGRAAGRQRAASRGRRGHPRRRHARARSRRSTSPPPRRWASWRGRSTTCTARPSTWPPARPPCVARSARCS